MLCQAGQRGGQPEQTGAGSQTLIFSIFQFWLHKITSTLSVQTDRSRVKKIFRLNVISTQRPSKISFHITRPYNVLRKSVIFIKRSNLHWGYLVLNVLQPGPKLQPRPVKLLTPLRVRDLCPPSVSPPRSPTSALARLSPSRGREVEHSCRHPRWGVAVTSGRSRLKCLQLDWLVKSWIKSRVI